jgi:hypothetical protein
MGSIVLSRPRESIDHTVDAMFVIFHKAEGRNMIEDSVLFHEIN